MLPAAIFNAPVPEAADAHRELLRISARALGVATSSDLRDYFRLSPADMKGRIEELVEAGDLLPVRVEGWQNQAYLHSGARIPRKVHARALLAPFDPLVFERSRAERLFPSATASRSTRPPKSASTATTSCPSCSATPSSPAPT